MAENQSTEVGRMTVLRREKAAATEPANTHVEWKQHDKRHPGEAIMRNMAVAAAMLICAVALRSGALPELTPAADAVLTAVKDDSLLDDQLGRLSFVGSLFPEASLVFGAIDDELALPVSGGTIVHAWSEAEPWMSWKTGSDEVTSASDGEVIGVYHGNGDERIVQVLGADGIACLYGNLAQVHVQTGDQVAAGAPIGTLLTGADAVFEVRRDGMSIDPALLLGGA